MSSHDTKNPNGGVSMGHVIEPPDPNSNLLELVLFHDNMHLAWKRVKSNKGAPGVDDISIKEFPDIIRDKWEGIRESLMEGTYEPSPVLRVERPKPTGGTRPLGIPIVLDRLIQQAIARVLTPIFDPEFSDFSFGFRPGRSAHDAVSRKGPWHLARTLATQAGMTNQWLKKQGLISIKELWVNIHYPAMAR